MSQTTLRGIVHGKTIELETDPGFPSGQEVHITVQPVTESHLPPGEGLRRSFGAWADDTGELDEYLEWNRLQRKQTRPEINS